MDRWQEVSANTAVKAETFIIHGQLNGMRIDYAIDHGSHRVTIGNPLVNNEYRIGLTLLLFFSTSRTMQGRIISSEPGKDTQHPESYS